MYCWSCGEYLPEGRAPCPACGAAPGGSPRRREYHANHIRSCPGCGYRGDGIPYFRRAGHAALLVAATVFTYGIGGLAYWLVKRDDRICPSCGLSWERARLGAGEPEEEPQRAAAVERRGEEALDLPRAGLGRRVMGVVMALFATFLLGMGIVEAEAAMVVISTVLGLTGASTFAWGWRSLQRRREALLQSMQRSVLRLAWTREGRLTTTDVAAEMNLSLPAAERVLLSLDDGFRVRTEVTDEGLLVFDFPEIRYQLPGRTKGGAGLDSGPGGRGKGAEPPTDPAPSTEPRTEP